MKILGPINFGESSLYGLQFDLMLILIGTALQDVFFSVIFDTNIIK